MKEKSPTSKVKKPLLDAVSMITANSNVIIIILNIFITNPFLAIVIKIKIGID